MSKSKSKKCKRKRTSTRNICSFHEGDMSADCLLSLKNRCVLSDSFKKKEKRKTVKLVNYDIIKNKYIDLIRKYSKKTDFFASTVLFGGNEGDLSKKEIKIILKEADILREKNRTKFLKNLDCKMYIDIPGKTTREISANCYYDTFSKKNKVENDLCNINEDKTMKKNKVLRIDNDKNVYWGEAEENEDINECKLI